MLETESFEVFRCIVTGRRPRLTLLGNRLSLCLLLNLCRLARCMALGRWSTRIEGWTDRTYRTYHFPSFTSNYFYYIYYHHHLDRSRLVQLVQRDFSQ
jgi:hypothetical protein